VPIKIPFVADVARFLAGTQDAERGLDDVSDSLSDLARSADQDAERIERSFEQAFDKLKAEGRTATRRVADDVDHFRRDGGGAMADFKDEARQNLAESVSSFEGNASSAVDAVQSTFGGLAAALGPAGLIGTTVVAAGIGMARGLFAAADEETQKFKERVGAMFDELRENNNQITVEFKEDGIAELLGDSERLQAIFGSDDLRKVNQTLKEIGLSAGATSQLFAGLTGGTEDVEQALYAVTRQQQKWFAILNDPSASATARGNAREQIEALARIKRGLENNSATASEATARTDLYNQALGKLPKDIDTDVTVSDHGTAKDTDRRINHAARRRNVPLEVVPNMNGVDRHIRNYFNGKVYQFQVAPRPGKNVAT